MKEVGGEEGEGRRRGEEESQEEERHYQGRVRMPPALALRPWMAPPGTKVAHPVWISQDALGWAGLTGLVCTPLCCGLTTPILLPRSPRL